MPYIKQLERPDIDHLVERLADAIHHGIPGDMGNQDMDGRLNYAITRLVCQSFAPAGRWRYSLIARAVGCLACVSAEFYRRVAGPYEDACVRRNGDVTDFIEALDNARNP